MAVAVRFIDGEIGRVDLDPETLLRVGARAEAPVARGDRRERIARVVVALEDLEDRRHAAPVDAAKQEAEVDGVFDHQEDAVVIARIGRLGLALADREREPAVGRVLDRRVELDDQPAAGGHTGVGGEVVLDLGPTGPEAGDVAVDVLVAVAAAQVGADLIGLDDVAAVGVVVIAPRG